MAATRDADWLERNGLTLREAAERMSCGESTARSRVKRGLVQGRRVQRGGRQVWLIDPQSIGAFVESDTQRALASGQVATLHAVNTEAPASSPTAPDTPADASPVNTEAPASSPTASDTPADASPVVGQLLERVRVLEARVEEVLTANTALRADNEALQARFRRLQQRNAQLRKLVRLAVDDLGSD